MSILDKGKHIIVSLDLLLQYSLRTWGSKCKYQIFITHLCTSRLITPQLTMILCILYSPLPRYIRWVSGFGFAMNIVTRYHLISASALLVYQHNPQLMSWPTQHAATVRRPHEARGTKDEGRAKKHVQIRASALRIHDATHSMPSAGGIRGCYVLCFFPRPNCASEEQIHASALCVDNATHSTPSAVGRRNEGPFCLLSPLTPHAIDCAGK